MGKQQATSALSAGQERILRLEEDREPHRWNEAGGFQGTAPQHGAKHPFSVFDTGPITLPAAYAGRSGTAQPDPTSKQLNCQTK